MYLSIYVYTHMSIYMYGSACLSVCLKSCASMLQVASRNASCAIWSLRHAQSEELSRRPKHGNLVYKHSNNLGPAQQKTRHPKAQAQAPHHLQPYAQNPEPTRRPGTKPWAPQQRAPTGSTLQKLASMRLTAQAFRAGLADRTLILLFRPFRSML